MDKTKVHGKFVNGKWIEEIQTTLYSSKEVNKKDNIYISCKEVNENGFKV